MNVYTIPIYRYHGGGDEKSKSSHSSAYISALGGCCNAVLDRAELGDESLSSGGVDAHFFSGVLTHFFRAIIFQQKIKLLILGMGFVFSSFAVTS